MKISVYDNQLTQSRYYTKYRGHTIIIGRLGIFWAFITNAILFLVGHDNLENCFTYIVLPVFKMDVQKVFKLDWENYNDRLHFIVF
jgi:hypothetical protein